MANGARHASYVQATRRRPHGFAGRFDGRRRLRTFARV